MIGIIGALDKELILLFEEMTIEHTDMVGDKTFYIGRLKNHKVAVVKSGIGKVNAAITTSILLTKYQARLVINIGIAGGLKPLDIGDIILAQGIAYFDVSLTAIDQIPYGQMGDDPLLVRSSEACLNKAIKIFDELGFEYHLGNLVSGDKFVTSAKEIKKISKHVDHILGVEMEGMAIALTAHKFNVPFVSIRGVSDIIDSKDQKNAYQTKSIGVAEKTTQFTLKLLEVIDD